jgi:hypothetical protein
MDNFDLQKYLASGKIHADNTTLTEAKKQGYDDREDESLGARKGAEKDKKQSMKDRRDDSYGKFGKRDAEKKGKNKINKEEIEVKEDARTRAEEEGFLDGKAVEKADMKKMKVSELKAKIKEEILAELSLSEADEEVDVDIDVEDEVEVEASADDIEIERKGVKTKVEVGLSPEEEIIQDSLKAAMDSANALGNDKLADQIGNTITFFTREYVVGDRS